MELKFKKWHFEVWKMTYCLQGEKEMPKDPNPIGYWMRVLLSPLCALLWFVEVCIIAPILFPFEFYKIQKILKFLYWCAVAAILILAFLKS